MHKDNNLCVFPAEGKTRYRYKKEKRSKTLTDHDTEETTNKGKILNKLKQVICKSKKVSP